jgi:hypothetical protein
VSIENQIATLKFFNQKAERLFATRYVQFQQERRKLSVNLSQKRGEALKVTKDLPDQDAIDAFLLTFRFFNQNNEPTSLDNMEKLYETLKIDEKTKNEFKELRQALNNSLDTPDPIFVINGVSPTFREIMDVFIYGGLAHSNKEKRKKYEQWQSSPLFALFEQEFCYTLFGFLSAIKHATIINQQAIDELEKERPKA